MDVPIELHQSITDILSNNQEMLLEETSKIRKIDIKDNKEFVEKLRNAIKMTVFLICYYLDTTIVKETKVLIKDDMLQEKEGRKKKTKVPTLH